MGRVLVLVLLVVLVVWLIRRALRPAAREPSAPQDPKRIAAGELVSCARCGLNLPREEARESGGSLFCSDEHARLGT